MGGKGSGRPRKSLQQHLLDGSYRKDRHGDLPAGGLSKKTLPKDIQPPEWFSPQAKVYYLELAPRLIELGTLDFLNVRLFECLCLTLADIEKMHLAIDKEGLTIGNKPHPLHRACAQYMDTALKLFREFGMTPRARVGKKRKGEPEDPMERLLNSIGDN